MTDNRPGYIHAIHSGGHLINAWMKEGRHPGIETTHIYRSVSPGKAAKGPWSKQVDYDRAKYHFGKTFHTQNQPCSIF